MLDAIKKGEKLGIRVVIYKIVTTFYETLRQIEKY